MLPLWPLVVSPPSAFTTPPWDSYSTGWQRKGWETSVRVQPRHVNGRTTGVLQSERMASRMPLKEDFNSVSHRMCVCVWQSKKKKWDSHQPLNWFTPTSIRLSASQHRWFTAPHLHVEHWLASIQTCVCDVYCFWLEVLASSIQFHHEKYRWNTHQSTELINNRSVCNNRKGPRREKKQLICR